MKIEEATIEQLKVLAYDSLAAIEQNQANLKIINGEIAKRNKMENEETTTGSMPHDEVVTNTPETEGTDGGTETPLEVGDVTPEPEAE